MAKDLSLAFESQPSRIEGPLTHLVTTQELRTDHSAADDQRGSSAADENALAEEQHQLRFPTPHEQTDANHHTLPKFDIVSPSESDEDADTSCLQFSHVWAYPCKLQTCPRYGKAWLSQSNFFNHLKNQQTHQDDEATRTRPGRKAQALLWRYETSLHDPPRQPPSFASREPEWIYSFRHADGTVRSGRTNQTWWL